MTATETKLKKLSPGSKAKREQTRKQGRCQMCLTKVPIEEQYTVTNNLKTEKVTTRKDAKDKPDASHYCGDCAPKRVKMKERWFAARRKRLAAASA